ncbi:MAG: hypothetical protein A2X56_04440 [Nitrospirae bacterium GWC2_57_13]|jgi:hypothetical protein|nr:MAG: hypothetical protein A2X56_04440 [Nitrospirae bacterium GWC2_57_13]OGW43632.1 MAG: hypothetical protein A2X57_12775 [Nitrospirae bacterium GWD2_57_8]HAS53603.1 hypothetical protein [Nitrospiraceae bacterium]
MLTGYNTDFKFQGKIYHIQTEDGGLGSPNITSLLYYGGAIIGSKKTSYADIVKADCLDEVVRELMMEQHKQVIRDFMQGKIDLQKQEHDALEAKTALAAAAPAAKVVTPPPPVKDVKEKSLDEVILDFLAQEEKARSRKT